MRQHARFDVDKIKSSSKILGSRNGVMVNGEKISQLTKLNPGDSCSDRQSDADSFFWPGHGQLDRTGRPYPTFDALGVVGELAEKAMALGAMMKRND